MERKGRVKRILISIAAIIIVPVILCVGFLAKEWIITLKEERDRYRDQLTECELFWMRFARERIALYRSAKTELDNCTTYSLRKEKFFGYFEEEPKEQMEKYYHRFLKAGDGKIIHMQIPKKEIDSSKDLQD